MHIQMYLMWQMSYILMIRADNIRSRVIFRTTCKFFVDFVSKFENNKPIVSNQEFHLSWVSRWTITDTYVLLHHLLLHYYTITDTYLRRPIRTWQMGSASKETSRQSFLPCNWRCAHGRTQKKNTVTWTGEICHQVSYIGLCVEPNHILFL